MTLQLATDATVDTAPLALIVAVARNGTIGSASALPWRLPEDLAHFRALTLGHSVIMGRKTWDSLGRALPGRQNIVVTRQPNYEAPGAEVVASLTAALRCATLPAPAFCIGGGELYVLALPYAKTLYVTEIDGDYAGDTVWPAPSRQQWRETARDARSGTPQSPAFAFVTYERRHTRNE